MADTKVDVAIVGAGLVGASLACVLASKHPQLRVALVEASQHSVALPDQGFDPRVVALTRQSQQWLNEAGIWPAILAKRACPYQRMHVWDAEGTASIDFSAAELNEPDIGHIVENALAVSLLHERIEQLPNIDWVRGAAVEQLLLNGTDNRLLLSDSSSVAATLIVAADGANSKLRQLAALPTREWDYQHTAIVTTVRCEHHHQFTAWQRFMPTGPLAFLPLQDDQAPASGQHYCSIVWSAETTVADELMAESDEDFCQSLSRAFEHTLGQVTWTDRRHAIALRQRHAIDYARQGLVLVGDAAHSIHPLAGQGVNLGFADVQALEVEISRALVRQLNLSDTSILRRYQRQRKTENLTMMAAMEGFKRLFGSRDLAVGWLRNEGLKQVASVPALKKLIARQALGL